MMHRLRSAVWGGELTRDGQGQGCCPSGVTRCATVSTESSGRRGVDALWVFCSDLEVSTEVVKGRMDSSR